MKTKYMINLTIKVNYFFFKGTKKSKKEKN